MSLVSPLLKHAVYPALARSGYLRRQAGAGPAVVTYHGVLPAGYRVLDPGLDGSLITAETFRHQLRLLKENYHVISPEQFFLWCESKVDLPPRSILLTCDDGLRNVLTDMLPTLQEASLSCLFFVLGDSLGDTCSMLWYEELYLMFLAGPESFELNLVEIALHEHVTGRKEKRSLWWNLVKNFSRCGPEDRRGLLTNVRRQLGLSGNWDSEYRQDPACGRRLLMLSLAELRRLIGEGMSVGAHTLSHPMLSQLSPESAWIEISESRRAMEQALDKPVWALAYPFGDPSSVTPREIEMAERAGFTCAFVNVGGGLGAKTSRFAMPRVHVSAGMGFGEFEAHISGFYGWLRHRSMPWAEAGTMRFAS
jgi:peptidoglycan/xylan/chitin deacetylase (PgdA/CDA1 family)